MSAQSIQNVMCLVVLQLLSTSAKPRLGWHPDVTPMITPTNGAPWPKPQQMTTTTDQLMLNSAKFQFLFNSSTAHCDVLNEAFDRYYDVIFRVRSDWLDVGKDFAELVAVTQWGAIRGLETFSQLIYESNGMMVVNVTSINDWPRFPHRGILLDTSLHYIGTDTILKNLDAMAYNKFNVFHWHMVGDYSFPYQSTQFPSMSAKGAFDPYTHVYSQKDIASVISYARLRGIRVIPEFESPAHTLAWGKGQSGILTACYMDGKADGTFGPINPTQNTTYNFLRKLYGELCQVFADQYIALGGDEVDFYCWQSNPDIQDFMKKQGYGDDFVRLEEYYFNRLSDIVSSLNRGFITWEDALDNGIQLRKDAIIQVWKGVDRDYPQRLANVTSQGYRVLLSSPWYLNYVQNPYSQDWKLFYNVNPLNFTGSEEMKSLVLGGEVCMWSEYVDSTNMLSRLWPRASAAGERLWSAESVKDVDEAIHRLTEHRCRMVRRGIPAEPSTGPGYCKYEYRP
ncbi:beta-hexosaminidase subunit alpha-like [Glandiceps talaboti]